MEHSPKAIGSTKENREKANSFSFIMIKVFFTLKKENVKVFHKEKIIQLSTIIKVSITLIIKGQSIIKVSITLIIEGTKMKSIRREENSSSKDIKTWSRESIHSQSKKYL